MVLRGCDIVDLALLKLCNLAVVPVLNRTVVAGDTAVNFRLLAADGAGVLLALEIAVIRADGVCRRERVVGQFVVFGNLSYEVCRRLPAIELLTEDGVEYRTRRLESLQIVLNVEGGEDIRRVAYG